MHALKFYGSRTERQILYGAARARTGPVGGRTIFVQNSPGISREQPVRGPGGWCDWGITSNLYRATGVVIVSLPNNKKTMKV